MAMTTELSAARDLLTGISGGEKTPVLAAVSGGLDSMCLLHLLTGWGRERGFEVTAAHFNHRLRGAESDRDEAFVRDWCAAHEIPFVSGQGDVRALAAERGLSPEEAAREARYAFLTEQKQLRGCRLILTAHHADDNAETLLLNLLRGTGLRGLCGIPERRGDIVRPFLRVTREELAAYAEEHGIPHVEDSTNALDEAARNVLRHRVLPVLKELNPRAVENMARTAELLRTDETVLTAAAEALLERAARIKPGAEAALSPEILRDEPEALVSRVVWSALRSVGGHERDLTARHVEAVCGLLRGPEGRELSLPWGMTARRTGDALLVCRRTPMERAELRPGIPLRWGEYTLTLLDRREGEGLALGEWTADLGHTVAVGPAPPGDRLTLPGSRGPRTVKRLCLDRRVDLDRRSRLPAVYVDGRLAAVWLLGVDTEFVPEGAACRFVQIKKETEERRHEE